MEKLCFEDWQVGDRALTAGRTITETDLVLFALLTGDWHPLHTDVEYAKDTAFRERIAHGLLILAIGSGLLVRASTPTPPSKSLPALWGIEKARFVAPTRIGDTVHLESEVVNLVEIDEDRGLITMRHDMKNHRGEDLLIFTTKVLVGRRARDGAAGREETA
ncbi:MAG: MaoC family dehydratase N-terminal domain-containing protein [Candidatus Rokubacteria bacterium]|nr:MaoC family dehydratase N-terminal domain-containing protein [Candidatus Rokubacteria bacterium]